MRDELHRALRREILDCVIAPGTELREHELAERFSVSKSPVRDALLRLESERLVVVHPRRGYQAAPISLSDAADLFDFRAIIEPACARDIAARADGASLQGLDRFRSRAAFAALMDFAGDVPFVAYNRAFHLALADMTPNRRLAVTARDLIEHFDRLVIVSLRHVAGDGEEQLIAEHAAIIDALMARDGRTAAKLLSDHAGRARKRVLGALSRLAVVP